MAVTETQCEHCGEWTEVERTTTHCSECGGRLALKKPTPLWKLRNDIE